MRCHACDTRTDTRMDSRKVGQYSVWTESAILLGVKSAFLPLYDQFEIRMSISWNLIIYERKWTLDLGTDRLTDPFEVSFIDMTGRWWWFLMLGQCWYAPWNGLVEILKLIFGQEFEAEVWSGFWTWILPNLWYDGKVPNGLWAPLPPSLSENHVAFFGKHPNKALFKGLKSGTWRFGLIIIYFGSVTCLLTAASMVNAFNPFGSVMPLAMFEVLSLFWKWDKMILS